MELHALANLSILVVEDEPTLRLTLSYLLRKAGYEVSICASAEEAKKLVQTGRFFAALIDLVLGTKGKFEGLDIVRAVRRRSPDTRVIVMTAYGDADVRREALAGGADSYWDKPINVQELLQEVRRLKSSSKGLP